MKRKILFVVNHPEFFLSHRLPFALAAREKGFDVHVATSETPRAREITEHGLTWHKLPLSPGGKNPVDDYRLYRYFLHFYRKLQPDLIHHVTIKPVLYGTLATRKAKVPAVVNALTGLGHLFSTHTVQERVLSAIILRLLKKAFTHPNCKLILQNPDDLKDFVDHNIIERDNIELIKGSGVDTEQFQPHPEVKGNLNVILASRLLWNKGVGEFVKAAGLINKKGNGAQFILAGDPDANNPLSIPEHQLKEWDQEDTVEWRGFRSNMAEEFRKSHVVVLPSYYGEGVPKVLIEAASAGKPIVTTDMPGCREIVQDGINGYLVPPRDSQKLAEAIQKLLNDKTLREQMGQKGREMVLREYSLETVVERTLGVYEELLSETDGWDD